MLSNLYHARDCHCGIPILDPDSDICSGCELAECGKDSVLCVIFHEYEIGKRDRIASRNLRYHKRNHGLVKE